MPVRQTLAASAMTGNQCVATVASGLQHLVISMLLGSSGVSACLWALVAGGTGGPDRADLLSVGLDSRRFVSMIDRCGAWVNRVVDEAGSCARCRLAAGAAYRW